MMAEGLVIDPSTTRYGPVGFAAAMMNILVLEVVTWLFIPWLILAFFALPVRSEGLVIDPSTTRYGPVGFAAAMMNILVLEVVTWLFIPWLILAFFALPV